MLNQQGQTETLLAREFDPWDAIPTTGNYIHLPLVSRERKNGSYSSHNCTPFLHFLLTKGKYTP